MLSYLLLNNKYDSIGKGTKKSQMKYIMSYKRTVPQLVLWKTNESIAIRIVEKSMGDHRANVEDIANVVEHIRNVDP